MSDVQIAAIICDALKTMQDDITNFLGTSKLQLCWRYAFFKANFFMR
jgi:hypothetical protein